MPEASCLSVSFPNYRMFYRYRKQNETANWGVLLISTQVLIEKPCLFLPANAASATVREALHGRLDQIIGIRGFDGMFAERPTPTRVDQGLSPDLTTDPQAEVLILDAIDPNYFLSVALLRSDAELVASIGQSRPGLPVTTGGAYFKPRHDYQWWRLSVASDDLLSEDDEMEF